MRSKRFTPLEIMDCCSARGGNVPLEFQRGFTLVEVIVVLLIISLSIALVTPSLSRLSKSVELKSAVKKISAILRYYRSEAVNKGMAYQVLFDSDLKEVRVQPIELSEETEDEKEGDAGKKESPAQKSYLLPKEVQIKEVKVNPPLYESEIPVVEFYPNGGSNGGTILLEMEDQKGYQIKIHFLTGIVAIEKVST